MYSDKLSIETPEQITLEYDVAGIGSRFLAVFVDSLIQLAVLLLLLFASLWIGISIRSVASSAGTWTIAIATFILFLLYWGYFAAFEIVWKGQTPGKRAAHIRVINESGREARLFEALVRNLVRIIDYMPGFYGVGIVSMFVSSRNKRIGDHLAGTIVVHDRKPSEEMLFFNTRETALSLGPELAALNLNDVQVIEAFLQRRLDLDLDVRRNTAFKLAEYFGARCNVPQADRRDDENFLEFLVLGFRKSARIRQAAR